MPLSFFEFCGRLPAAPLLSAAAGLILAVLLVNGWTDAPNAITGVVVTGTLPFRRAAALAAVFNFCGVLCVTSVNASVAETVYSIARFSGRPEQALIALCAAMAAIVIWAAGAWWFGIPTSESHALLAGVTGGAAALEGGLARVRWESWGRVLLGLLLSTLAGFWCGRAARVMTRSLPASSRTVRWAQISGAAALATLHGAQDGQKLLGIFLLSIALAGGKTQADPFPLPLWAMGICALFMGLGTLLGGRRIIQTVGRDMVHLGPKEGLAADLGCALCLLAATVFGLPVSTTHTRTSAMLGAGGGKQSNRRVIRRIVLAWLFTFPCCTALGYGTARLFLRLFG